MELNERPWSLRTDQTAAERATSPLTGMAGAVSISAYLTRWARKEAEERRLKFLVAEIPILVDMAEQPSPRPLPDGAPMLVFAGAPQYDETIDFILNAMEHVWRDHPTCRLAITGARAGDPAAEALTSRIAGDVGDDGRVLFAGYLPRPELLALYQDATALLIPLFDDVRSLARFPTKTGEYLASGRPVVTTGVGEMARAFTDGEDAVVAPAGDPGEYGRRICALLADRESASRIGSAGREYARAHFDYGLHGASLVQAFSEVGSVAFSPRGTSLRAGVRGAAGAVHAARRRRPGGRRGPR
jgi:glycosyltransferase involved in cell wall biosynthesis